MVQLAESDLASRDFKANPYPDFAWLRTHDPVHQLTSSGGQRVWLITRYQDAELVLRDERFIKDSRKLQPPEGQAASSDAPIEPIDIDILRLDPPDHARLRKLVSLSFTPRLVEQWHSRIQVIADELIDSIEGKGSMDLIEEFAFALPILVISEMLGVPAEDNPELHRLTTLIVDALSNPATFQQAAGYLQSLHRYLETLIESKQQAPADDLVSKLVQAEAAGDRLSTAELLSMVSLLIITGYETTGNLIGNGILALLLHPDQMTLLKQDPALIKLAVEEFLRYYSPLMLATLRWAGEDLEFHGKQIRRGEEVAISLSAANRDEEEFAEPDRLDITRQENRHLAFGRGPHFCLGAPLARLEVQIAINTVLRRLPDLRLQVEPEALVWRPGTMVLGLEHLPVRF